MTGERMKWTVVFLMVAAVMLVFLEQTFYNRMMDNIQTTQSKHQFSVIDSTSTTPSRQGKVVVAVPPIASKALEKFLPSGSLPTTLTLENTNSNPTRLNTNNHTKETERLLPEQSYRDLPTIFSLSRTSSVYLTDAVIVPKFKYIYVTGILRRKIILKDDIITGNKPEGTKFWLHNHDFRKLKHPCTTKSLKQLEIVFKDSDNENERIVRLSETCERHLTAGFNIIHVFSFTKYRLSDEVLNLIMKFAANDDHLPIRINQHAYFTIDLKSRSSGFFRHHNRLPVDLSKPSAYANPFTTIPKHSISVCIKWSTSKNPYFEQIAAYYKASGYTHIYVGVDTLLTQQRLLKNLNYKHYNYVSFIPMQTIIGNLMLVAPGSVFSTLCLHHAKQQDAMVGSWDMDEFPLIIDPAYSSYRYPNLPHFGKYLLDTVNKGNISVYNESLWKYIPPNGITKHDLNYYSEFIFEGYYISNTVKTMIGSRQNRLEVDFPLRSNYSRYFTGPMYMKCVVICATTNVLEVHKHSNMDVFEVKSIYPNNNTEEFNVDVSEHFGRIPFLRRLYPDPKLVAMMHFANMFTDRRFIADKERDQRNIKKREISFVKFELGDMFKPYQPLVNGMTWLFNLTKQD